MAMDAEERREHCRRIAARGGRATVARHGTAHMREIGRAGFKAALESIGGIELYKIIGAAYEAKFGRALDVHQCRNADASRQRADCRKRHPEIGGCEWIECDDTGAAIGRCGAPAAQRHHVEGLRGGNERPNIQFYCETHHRAVHRMARPRRRG